MGADHDSRESGKDRYCPISYQGDNMHDQRIIVRYDGVQDGLDMADGLCFTVVSHFVGIGGRCFFKSSWIGVASLLANTGIDLDRIQIVMAHNNGPEHYCPECIGPDSADVSIAHRK